MNVIINEINLQYIDEKCVRKIFMYIIMSKKKIMCKIIKNHSKIY